MALVDPTNGRFLKVNAAGCRMLGYAEDELKALSIQDVTAPGDREESFGRYRKVIEGEVSFSQAKLHYLRSDGSTAYGIISTALVRDAQGEPLHLVANVVDITEQVRAQDKLEETVASKDQLIASVSHELRTPLTGILGFSEILRDETSSMSTDERVELVQTIANQTTDLTNIVEDLLVAARTDNETLTVVRVPVDLRAQAAQVVETLARTGHPDVLVTGGTARAQGDPARVRQILRNLISNAFRYGGENIEVVAYECDSSSCVAVTDDGPGVPDDDQERIFEPYQRVSHREGLTASIGLGLTVSKKLANLMEGELTYRYENERSIFELILPSIQEDQ
jgi:PAS domain S-box-containing protein